MAMVNVSPIGSLQADLTLKPAAWPEMRRPTFIQVTTVNFRSGFLHIRQYYKHQLLSNSERKRESKPKTVAACDLSIFVLGSEVLLEKSLVLSFVRVWLHVRHRKIHQDLLHVRLKTHVDHLVRLRISTETPTTRNQIIHSIDKNQ